MQYKQFFIGIIIFTLVNAVSATTQSVSSVVSSLPATLLTEKNLYKWSVTSPDSAWAAIRQMRKQRMFPEWQLNLFEADCYVNQRQFRRARPLYLATLENPAISDSLQLQMRLTKRIMNVDERLINDDEVAKYSYRLQQMAERANSDYYLAHALFVTGKRRHFQGDSTGMADCMRARDMMCRCNFPYKYNALVFMYADLLNMYEADGNYEQALRMSLLQEKAVHKINNVGSYRIDGNALRLTYALRASLYMAMGKREAADKTYELWKKTPRPVASDDKEILGYLVAANRCEEAMEVIRAYKSYLVSEGDSISHWMLFILGQEAIVNDIQGKYEETAKLYSDMSHMANELHKISSRRVMDTTYALLQQEEKTARRNLWLINISAILLLLVVTITIFFFYSHKLRQRNKAILNALNGLEAYRYTMVKNEEEKEQMALSAGQHSQAVNAGTTAAVETAEVENDSAADTDTDTDPEDKRLFVMMDQAVTRDKLFLNPNLGRDELASLINVNKNHFGRIMSRYSSAGNASSYINAKRAEYAAELLKKYPTYTMAAIAEMCGMSNTVTFNRTFKSIYGITPSEFRNAYVENMNDEE